MSHPQKINPEDAKLRDEDRERALGGNEERPFRDPRPSRDTERTDDRLGFLLRQLKDRICTDEELAEAEGTSQRWTRSEMLRASRIILPDDDREIIEKGALRDEPGLVYAKEFLAQRDWPGAKFFLIIMGTTGTGKTIASGWALTQIPGLYIEAQRLCFLQKYQDEREKVGVEYHRHLTAGLLVVDELGTEEDEERARMMYREVLNKRMKGRRPTIILGNGEAEQLKTRFDERTLDRIHARGMVRGLDGPSLRVPSAPRRPGT